MNRIFFIVMLTLLSLTGLFFQNCSAAKTEWNASANYSAPNEVLNVPLADDSKSVTATLPNRAVDFFSTPDQYSMDQNPSIGFSIVNGQWDNLITFRCKFDSEDWMICQSQLRLSHVSEGLHSLLVKAVTRDNESMVKSFSWTTDTIAPNLVFNSAPPNYVGTRNLQISFSATDAGAGVLSSSCKLDTSDWVLCTSPFSFSNLADGTHTFKVRTSDKAGNVQEISKIWNVDLNYAYIALTGKPGTFVKTTSASFAFNVENGLTFNQFECQFDSESSFTTCSTGKSYSISDERSYTFNVRAKNSQGYYTSTLSYSFTRDNTGPAISLVSPANLSSPKNAFSVAVNVDDGIVGSGVSSISCTVASSVNGVDSQRIISPCAFPLDLTDQLSGVYTLTVTAKDTLNTTTVSSDFKFFYQHDEKEVPFITINLSGGAALAANVIPMDSEGNFLESYNRLGLGSKDAVTASNTKYLGARWANKSGMLAGIQSYLSNSAAAKTRVFALPVSSLDNSSKNPFDVQTFISDSGLLGSFVRNTSNHTAHTNGLGEALLLSGIPGMSTPLNTVFVPLAGFTGSSGNPGYTKFADFPLISNYSSLDPVNSSFKTLFKISDGSDNLTIPEIVLNSINGNSGPANINLGGYDYRNADRSLADAKDKAAGELIGQSLQYAFLTNKKLMIYVPTDGAPTTPINDECCAGWTADRGGAGQLLFFVIDPDKGFAESDFSSSYMIGQFKGSNQMADDSFWSNPGDAYTAQEKAAMAVVANYLQLSGKQDQIPTITRSVIKAADISKYVKVVPGK